MAGLSKHYILRITGHLYVGKQALVALRNYIPRVLETGLDMRLYQEVVAANAGLGYKKQLVAEWRFYKRHPNRDRNATLTEYSVRHGHRNSSYGQVVRRQLGGAPLRRRR